MTTIKELHEIADQYHRSNGRPKFADLYVYACFLDYVHEFGQWDSEPVLNDGVTIETVWDKYVESDFVIDFEYGYEGANDWASSWFRDQFTHWSDQEPEEEEEA